MSEFMSEFMPEFMPEFRFEFLSDFTLDVELICLIKFVISNIKLDVIICNTFIYQLLGSLFSGWLYV
ncbi:MAG: hypothetical protein ACI92O_003324 [Colwellia sp.]|jgi:hypothetical protein